MICARCAADTFKSPCSQCGASPYLNGRYRLEELVRRTGVSALYRGVEIMSRQRVALREFPVSGALDAEAVQGLNGVLARVSGAEHRGLAKILDAFASDNHSEPAWWVARTWVGGGSLRERVQMGPMDETDAVVIVKEILTVLAAVHAAGLPHGNLTVDTVVRKSDDSLMLVDPSAFSDHLLQVGLGDEERLGEGAAPEEARTGPSVTADIYRVGVLAASLMAGRLPQNLDMRPDGVHWTGKSRISPALAGCISEMTLADPVQRTSTVSSALQALQTAQDNPASLVGITSTWDEYVPNMTPPPIQLRDEAAAESEAVELAHSLSSMKTIEDLSLLKVNTRRQLPAGVVRGGPLLIGVPERNPAPQGGATWLLGLGCAGILVFSLFGGVGLGVWIAVNPDLLERITASPQDSAPAPAPVQTPLPPSPAPVPERVAPPAPVITEAPANPEMGLLRVRCDRRALIAINGRVVDRTPLDLELLPGEYELTATINGMPDWRGRREVTVRQGQTNEILLRL
jgi:serine/threonine protein kinase